MDKDLTLEQANGLLEQSVRRLEDKSLSLEQSLEEYARACELLAVCRQRLGEAKGKIEDINMKIAAMKQNGGELYE